jgi:hypothetical protein
MASISSFIGKIGQGVKPNMFRVEIPFPTGVGPGTTPNEQVNLLCKSAALPGSSLGVIEVPFRGRTIKIAGDRTFDTWSATFFNDKDMNTRGWFEMWLNGINNHNLNGADLPNLGGSDGRYSVDLKVLQLERAAETTEDSANTNANAIRTYLLKYAFPTSVSQIDLAYDSNDQIEEFTVEFQYSYWTATQGRGQGGSIPDTGAQIATASGTTT